MNNHKSNRTKLLIVLFLLAFGAKIGHQIVFYDLGYDKTRQMAASGNYIGGKGISDCMVSENKLSEITCTPQNWWASGYPLMLGWLTYLTKDFIVSDYILICLAFLILFSSSYFIFESIPYSSKLISPYLLFLIFSGVSIAPFHYLPTTELLSLSFLVAGCAASLFIVKGNYYLPSVLAGLLLFLAGFVKYNIYPFLILIPLSLSIVYVFTRKKQLISSIFLYSFTVLSGFFLLWTVLPNHLTSSWIGDFKKGWNWQNLLQIDVFPIKAFFFIDPILTRIEPYYWVNAAVKLGMTIGSFVIIFGILLYTFSNLKSSFLKKEVDVATYVYLLGALTILINIGFLIWISVRLTTIPTQINENWTFVWETRYFAPAIFFLPVFLFSLPFKIDVANWKLKTLVIPLVILPLAFGATYSAWKYFDVFVNNRLDGTFYAESADKEKVGKYLKEQFPTDSRSSVMTFLNYGEGYGASLLRWDYSQDKTLSLSIVGPGATRNHWDYSVSGDRLQTNEPVNVYFLMPKIPEREDREFIEKHEAVNVLMLLESDLYRMEVTP